MEVNFTQVETDSLMNRALEWQHTGSLLYHGRASVSCLVEEPSAGFVVVAIQPKAGSGARTHGITERPREIAYLFT